jgi:hypothetical protein
MKVKLDAKKKKELAVEAAQSAEVSAIPQEVPDTAVAAETPSVGSVTAAEAETNGIDPTMQAQIEAQAMAEA